MKMIRRLSSSSGPRRKTVAASSVVHVQVRAGSSGTRVREAAGRVMRRAQRFVPLSGPELIGCLRAGAADGERVATGPLLFFTLYPGWWLVLPIPNK